MSVKRIKFRGGYEYDAFTQWRKYYNWKSGALKIIKRGYNRRFRKVSKNLTKEIYE